MESGLASPQPKRGSSGPVKGHRRLSVIRAAPSYRSNPFVSAARPAATAAAKATAAEDEGTYADKEFDDKGGLHYLETMKEELHSQFIKNLPHEFIKSLPPRYQLGIGTFMYAAILSIAVSFFTVSYTSQLETRFLSPTFMPGLCDPVQRAADGVFLADTNGRWQGNKHYEYSQTLYRTTLSNLTSSLYPNSFDLYRMLVGQVYMTMDTYLRRSFSLQNLAQNLLYLCTWAMSSDVPGLSNTDNTQRLELTGNPAYVFNLPHKAAGLASGTGRCSVVPVVSLDMGTHRWSVSWDYKLYLADKACTDALSPTELGLDAVSDTLTISLDTRSFIAAAAVNAPDDPSVTAGQPGSSAYSLGRLYASNTLRVLGGEMGIQTIPLTDRGIPVEVGQYYDPRYSGMDPITCVRMGGKDNPLRCLLYLGGVAWGVPYFDHFGQNKAFVKEWRNSSGHGLNEEQFYSPKYCSCSDANSRGVVSGEAINTYGYQNCAAFDFLHGILFYKFSKGHRMSDVLSFLNSTNDLSTSTWGERGFKAAWYTVPHLRQNSSNSETDPAHLHYYQEVVPRTSEQRREDFGFCATEWGNCSMLMLRSTNDMNVLGHTHTINEFFYQYHNGSCTYDITNPKFQDLVDSPPVPLQESYFVCSTSTTSAFVQAVGAAFGNTAVAIPFTVILIIHLIFLAQWVTGCFIPRTYTADEKEEVLDGIATRLLVLRDARHKEEHEGAHVLLRELLKELQNTHDEEDVYFLREHEKERLKGLRSQSGKSSPLDSSLPGTTTKHWGKVLGLLREQRRSQQQQQQQQQPQKDVESDVDNPMQPEVELHRFAGSTRTGSIIPFSGELHRITPTPSQVDVIPAATEGERSL